MNTTKIIILLSVLVLGSLFFSRLNSGIISESLTSLTLNADCPPGFKKDADNRCVNKNLYLQYSVANAPALPGMPQIGRTATIRLLYDF